MTPNKRKIRYQPSNTKTFWDNFWEKSRKIGGVDYDANLCILNKIIRNYKRIKILEAGSGSGYFSAEMAKQGAYVTLIDISETSLRFASQYFQTQGMKKEGKFIQGDILSMPFSDNYFDVTWSGGVIEHFYDDGKKTALKEMARVTKSKGKLIVMVPNKWSFPFCLIKRLSEFRGRWEFGYEDRISAQKLRKLFLAVGIDDLQIFTFNPVVSWWWLPFGRRICDLFHLNQLKYHKLTTPIGHVLTAVGVKKEDTL